MHQLNDLDVAATLALLLPVAHLLLGASLAAGTAVLLVSLAIAALAAISPDGSRSIAVERRRRAWRSLLVALRRPDLPGRPQPRAPGFSPAGA
ncbi:DUF6412 domain-containing protein [Luteipulveratus mongoliensis]|uniref:Uncharacterized protein n=1 Tax=Luteipulveratus mongoliensis TaxID=571913 RepID=A0A0K1JG84_9MICO|nr:DUF6412 domain-containing protein [Luteipulveratus mongoliensis]AKU15709.1 hypothetical protein VV02_07345 [Luteipulveratus mongoliensis]